MRRRSRLPRVIKCCGVVACVAVLVLWLASFWWRFSIGYDSLGILVAAGAISIWGQMHDLPDGWSAGVGSTMPTDWWWRASFQSGAIVLPLWLVFLSVIALTGVLFWLDWRRSAFVRRPSRLRRVAKWSGGAAFLLILIGRELSDRWEVSWHRPDLLGPAFVLGDGRIRFLGESRRGDRQQMIKRYKRKLSREEYEFGLRNLRGLRQALVPPVHKMYGGWHVENLEQSFRFPVFLFYISEVNIPIWSLMFGVLIPTALLWWLDGLKPIPGFCKCGYDLKGNISGVCPECGERVA